MKILIAPTTFGIVSKEPLKRLKEKGWSYVFNESGRKLMKKDLLKYCKNIDGIIAGTETYDKEIFDRCSNLKVISRVGVGIDNIDLIFARHNNVKIFTTRTSPAVAVAELTVGLILSLLRKISFHNFQMRNGAWEKYMGELLSWKNIGIIGSGNIGKYVIKIINSFSPKQIFVYDKNIDEEVVKDNKVRYTSLDELLKASDIISIHLPLTDETKNLLSADRLTLIKKGAYLINTARSEIIDFFALKSALINKRISGCALDVYPKEPFYDDIFKLDNVVVTPHIGSYAKEIRIKMEIEAVENLIKGLEK